MGKRTAKEKAWMELTLEQSIIASLKKHMSPDELTDDQWLRFKDNMLEGDEIWYYRTPQETWTEWFPRCGREGYVLVRDDKVIDEILISVS
jgi:hypothetical protein